PRASWASRARTATSTTSRSGTRSPRPTRGYSISPSMAGADVGRRARSDLRGAGTPPFPGTRRLASGSASPGRFRHGTASRPPEEAALHSRSPRGWEDRAKRLPRESPHDRRDRLPDPADPRPIPEGSTHESFPRGARWFLNGIRAALVCRPSPGAGTAGVREFAVASFTLSSPPRIDGSRPHCKRNLELHDDLVQVGPGVAVALPGRGTRALRRPVR